MMAWQIMQTIKMVRESNEEIKKKEKTFERKGKPKVLRSFAELKEALNDKDNR